IRARCRGARASRPRSGNLPCELVLEVHGKVLRGTLKATLKEPERTYASHFDMSGRQPLGEAVPLICAARGPSRKQLVKQLHLLARFRKLGEVELGEIVAPIE